MVEMVTLKVMVGATVIIMVIVEVAVMTMEIGGTDRHCYGSR